MAQRPQLGSLEVHAPSLVPQIVHVQPSTCRDLSLFKDLLAQYRKLDDSITMRLNRANAQVRDQERISSRPGKDSVQNTACSYVWQELLKNWSRRTQLVEYCTEVVDANVQDKKQLQQSSEDPQTRRRLEAEMFSEEAKRKQIHNELVVERIVRQRTYDVFHSRCQYFSPPPSELWDSLK